MTWLADQLDREYRPVLRRINQAELRLAELIATGLRLRRGRIPASAEGLSLRLAASLPPATLASARICGGAN